LTLPKQIRETYMPKRTPDRDDSRGNLDGQGGPQDGPIGNPDQHQHQGGDLTETAGAGGQRSPGGSSRDSEKESRHG
jgi:hypothetical protein